MTDLTFSPGLAELVQRALAEDLGSGDVTSEATLPADARARAVISQKAAGVIYGLDAAALAFQLLDPDSVVERVAVEAEWREAGGEVLRVEGLARVLLAGERTALNFLAHLSGIATFAARCVREAERTGAQILDTRKTTPGLRVLEKAAVAAGGATNHRVGLYDAILIKENHVAAAGGIAAAVSAARAHAPDLPLEVEVRDADEIAQALEAGVERLLLDNMSAGELRDAVAQVAGRASLEASGGVTLETLREVAETGVQFVSMGALTHSAPALDLAMILQPLDRPRL
ncbi:MAG TPA: carboxylating nicotinate-nucleotide diphosphorylase [Solirubrobacteraceae bacterium]|nr:carboxylating nicotinate-nucleotide diphosphorylase [Solirubrobacteraceae bacterium]